jgi:hypothetical protein
MIDRSILNVLESAKAYAALVGSFLTLIVSTVGADALPSWVGPVVALLTAFSVWAVPNATPAAHDFYGDDGEH